MEVINRAKLAKSDYIKAINSIVGYEKMFKQSGFIVRKTVSSPYTYVNNAHFPSEILSNSDNWLISLGDGDICF